MNHGEPFLLDHKMLSPADLRAIIATQVHAQKEQLAGLQNLGEADATMVRKQADQAVLIEVANVMIARALRRVDTSLAQWSTEAIVEKLTIEQYTALMTDLKPAEAREGTPSAQPPFSSALNGP
jgi:hypothetical protein